MSILDEWMLSAHQQTSRWGRNEIMSQRSRAEREKERLFYHYARTA